MPRLNVGTATANITPPLGVRLSGSFYPRYVADIHDELFAKAIVFDNASVRLAVVVCDLIAIPRDRADAVKHRVENLCGIPSGNILVAATHTHSGPAPCWVLGTPPEEEYMDWAVARIADAVALACKHLQPARLGAAVGDVPHMVFNRRWHMKDGSVLMNPGYQNPDLVRPAGPVDTELPFLGITDDAGRPLAALANYALHYIGGSAGGAVSADYFGCFGRSMRRLTGSDLLAIMSNGCSGDINNIDYSQPAPPPRQPYERMEQVADVCAAEVYRVWRKSLEMTKESVLAVTSREVMVRKRPIAPDDLKAARARVAEGEKEPGDRDYFWAWQKTMVAEMPDAFPTLLQAFRVGDVGIVALPGEIFVEIGLQIKAASPAPITMPIELANGYLGYHCTDKALVEGSYETEIATSSLPAAGTEGLYVETCTEMLKELFGG